jgi:hypothetical protein
MIRYKNAQKSRAYKVFTWYFNIFSGQKCFTHISMSMNNQLKTFLFDCSCSNYYTNGMSPLSHIWVQLQSAYLQLSTNDVGGTGGEACSQRGGTRPTFTYISRDICSFHLGRWGCTMWDRYSLEAPYMLLGRSIWKIFD